MANESTIEAKWFDQVDDFWEKYQNGRPTLPASFYSKLYDYHSSHGGQFGTVYDMGGGYGKELLELSKRFSHVIVGDVSDQNLQTARQTLERGGVVSRCLFRNEKFEESTLPADSCDTVFISTAIHLTDIERSMATARRILKPGGTLLISFCAVPNFASDIQPAYWDLCDDLLSGEAGRVPKGTLERVCSIQGYPYDSIALPEEHWEPGALRLKINTKGDPDAFIFGRKFTKSLPRTDNVGPNDRIMEEADDAYFFEADTGKMRDIIATFPVTEPDPAMMERHFEKLEKLLDGKRCEAWWPCSIILATRRRDA